MFSYQPPLKDIRFVLSDLLDASAQLSLLPPFDEVDDDLMMQVAEEAGRFASEVLFPLNAVGDREGCHYENGVVKTPSGFPNAYRQFQEAGWPALACDPDYGGQGLPNTLNSVLYEMLSSSNHAWTMYPGLLHGAYACLHKHASEELKQRYLPHIISGQWLATMCLTESQAGSDLGLLRTRAIPQDDGSVRITGNKIFISGGEQDITENIVHLVLARLPDAPVGSKGISLFLVPKYLPEGNKLGRLNSVACTGIEHKMGIHGSATTSLQFDDAVGWIVGEPNRGLAAMFVMMNAARLAVGIQGLGSAETAYQNSLAYAQERLQMRAAVRPPQRRAEPADPIIMHPAMQRLLMTQRAYVEGFRMLAYYSALALDASEHHPDEHVRNDKDAELALLTPIIKSMMTDQGFHGSSQALQIYGGHGFITETGIEQYLRDSRIAMIYEGTNEIQAVDLLLRKILSDGGKRLEQFLGQIDATVEEETGGPLQSRALILADLASSIRKCVADIAETAAANPQLPHQVAPEMLRLVGHCALAWLWLRAERTALEKLQHDPAFYQAKRDTCRYYYDFVLPETAQLLQVIDNALKDSREGNQINMLSDVMRQYDETAP
ncbi:acyl-CoA dehydrogenase C-terminal domain-containing protein [Pusillimonas sp.]|uniref:acyl-CoA dehydrogenase C-terminal domain-containing protein n=1 Tax=Pusillimonas sp. TaxID=3040095 RepID=UPI0037CB137E